MFQTRSPEELRALNSFDDGLDGGAVLHQQASRWPPKMGRIFALRLRCESVHDKHLKHDKHSYRNPEAAMVQQVAACQ